MGLKWTIGFAAMPLVRSVALAGLAVAVIGFGTGCSDKVKAERDSLNSQNQQLQQQLAAEKAAREASDREKAELAARAAAGGPAVVAPKSETPAAEEKTETAGTDITRGKNKLGEDTLQISSDVLFDSGKAALKPSAKKTLDKAAAIVKKEYAGHTLRIEGYTDPNPVNKSGWDDNWDLGAARARAVLLYLESKGVPRKSMYLASFADTQLKSTTNFALDRRVEIVVVKTPK
jgi:chemotaxis protein MotB